MKIGTRIIKTGLAVAVTTYILRLLSLEPVVFGAISAVVNMQPSIHLTFKTAQNQILVHILGVAIGLVLGYTMGGNPLSMGLTTVIVIILCLKLKLESGILMGIVAAIFVLSPSSEQFLEHALTRSAVIFTGLAVALVINVTLWPPRHGRRFFALLGECNRAAVGYFCQAVKDFTHLGEAEIADHRDRRETVHRLTKETRSVGEFHLRGRKGFGSFGFADAGEKYSLAEKLMEYNEAIVEKADQIYDLLPSRLERRTKTGALPVSEEFRSMLELLESGCGSIKRVNTKLMSLVDGDTTASREKISEAYWEDFFAALEKWQPRLTGSYYLHALIEVAMVAVEIRWVAREGKKLVNLVLSSNKATAEKVF